MTVESPEKSPLFSDPRKFDRDWYAEYQRVSQFKEVSLLEGNKEFREKQKRAFLAGETQNPILDYPHLENFDFDTAEANLLTLKTKILNEEKRDFVRWAYRWKINERIAEVRRLKAARDGNDRHYTRYSKYIYGSPSKKIYEYTIHQVKSTIDKKMFSADADISRAARRLNTELFEALMNNENTIDPADYTLPELKTDNSEISFSPEEIRKIFEDYIKQHNLSGWLVSIDREGELPRVRINQANKTVDIPGHDRSFSQAEFDKLIEHELGTHALRRDRGERSKLMLLGIGLDRYLRGEEGIATYKQQLVGGTKDFRGLDYHFAVSLALGLDGKKRSFRQVFEILRDYHFINSTKEKKEAVSYASNEAWRDCVRIFRGTTCKTPGACFTRDIVYREGNIGIWDIVTNNPSEAKRFMIGKYDPLEPRHIWILEQLLINDEDLEDLEK